LQVPFGAGIKTLTACVAGERCRGGPRYGCGTAVLSLPQPLLTASHWRGEPASPAVRLWAPLATPEGPGRERDPGQQRGPGAGALPASAGLQPPDPAAAQGPAPGAALPRAVPRSPLPRRALRVPEQRGSGQSAGAGLKRSQSAAGRRLRCSFRRVPAAHRAPLQPRTPSVGAGRRSYGPLLLSLGEDRGPSFDRALTLSLPPPLSQG